VAAILAVLAAKDIPHGPLEGLFTIDEETGMTGAANLKSGWVHGRILLNLDTEEHGDLCIGCAGGMDTVVRREFPMVKPQGDRAVRIELRGLRGGHSGCDIHLGRGNANKLLNRLVFLAGTELGGELHRFEGGNLRNAIPREATAEMVFAGVRLEETKQKLQALAEAIATEYRRGEPDLQIQIRDTEMPASVIDPAAQASLVRALYAVPNGVFRMSEEMAGLVETSTSLARVAIGDGKAQVEFLTRSSVESGKRDLANAIHAAFRLADCRVEDVGGYPGWRPNADSPVLALLRQVFEQKFGKKPNVNAVHAGLECGIIGGHYPGMDMISFGPTIRNPHSPDEKCEIASVRKFWDLLVAVLAHVPVTG
jgi:dipeptidase D